jgi:hypothetical protein
MRIDDFLSGAADLHVHSSPDVDPRRYDDLDLAREAARAGMSALLIKSHQNSTVERAILVSRVVPSIRTFGGLVLNDTVGGLNPSAVQLALRLGAAQIWMPTRSARNHRRFFGESEDGISIFGPDGRIVPAVDRILELLAASECMLGTGHLSPEESVALIARASEKGVRKILVTHPEWEATFFPVELQRSLARTPGVWFERCYVSLTHRCGFTAVDTVADAIAEVGIDSTVLSTDLGQPDTPAPVDGLRLYADALRASGFNRDQIRRMMVDNPRALLGLEPFDAATPNAEPSEAAAQSVRDFDSAI